ncbi:hypothetical protein PEX1_021040 [Penicillium expansum]|uniref:Uncharacterized protein n=1 Tax=Penicillium expansum TaxID=27334 RepID=A0A0A2I0Z4_PENEN|nr:hypothetical protein PEX2_010250 [Penicillium expansum]KGO36877.1 hypothetical protein PEXP_006760 [Penicillium expansum]KGO51458.1 hypothetical protein PEX2_010250 [Penicillium expansum]KGO64215.1 hypothetical protein PEX1_021040 [Penicillium expansum]
MPRFRLISGKAPPCGENWRNRSDGKELHCVSTPPTTHSLADPIRLGEENHRELSLELNFLWFPTI